jgi:hypothetical protein
VLRTRDEGTRRLAACGLSFLGQRPIDALALGRDGLPARILTCEWSGTGDRLAARGIDIDALERRESHRRAWSSFDLTEVLAGQSAAPGTPLLSYALDLATDQAARRAGFLPISGCPALKDAFDDKRATRAMFERLGWPGPALVDAAATDFPAVGGRMVVQAIRGSNGQGTRVVRTAAELADATAAGAPLVSRWVDGPVLNVHILVGDDGVTVSPWSVQAAGVPELGGGDCLYGGNDFGAAAEIGALLDVQGGRLATAIGACARQRGWRGLMGVDAILDGQTLVPLEVNPRLQGSSWLLAESQACHGQPVIGAAHRELLLHGTQPRLPQVLPSLAAGAFLIIRAPAARGASCVADGIHRLSGDDLVRVRDGLGLLDCATDELLVDGAARVPVEAAGVVVRVASWQRLLTSGGGLTPWGRRVVSALSSAAAPVS